MALGLRGASAEALATLRPQVVDGGDASSQQRQGEDLFAVATLLRAEPRLRRIATDVSTDAQAKSGLVRGILQGKVGNEALEVVAQAVTQRWTATRDLADVLEYLGVIAIVRSAGADAARLDDELFSVAQLVNGDDGLRTALSDPARNSTDKAGLLRGLLEGKALPATVRLAQQALNGSYRTVTQALEAYAVIAAEVKGEGVARVVVAQPLTEQDEQRLAQALGRQYGRDIHLNVVIDPDVLGGIRVEIGDDVIDGAVSSRLDEARRKLAG